LRSNEQRRRACPLLPTEPLKPDDFPLHVEADEIKSQDGKPVASIEDPAVAADVSERLNEDEDRREE
jgi:hypothetical protein